MVESGSVATEVPWGGERIILYRKITIMLVAQINIVSDDPVLSLWCSFLGQISLLLMHAPEDVV